MINDVIKLYKLPIAYNSNCWNVTIGIWYDNNSTVMGRTPCSVAKYLITTTGFYWGAYGGSYGWGMYYLAVGI